MTSFLKRNIKKIAPLLLLVVMAGTMLAAPTRVLAQTTGFSTNDPAPNANFFSTVLGCDPDEGITCLLQAFLTFILSIAFIVAVIYLVVGGFRYVTAGGNEDAVDTAKTYIRNAIIGLIVIVAAYFILRLVVTLVESGDPNGP